MPSSKVAQAGTRVLFELPRHPHPNCAVLAAGAQLEPALTWRALKWLEKKGWAERTRYPTRAMHELLGSYPWQLTPTGALHLEDLELNAMTNRVRIVRSRSAYGDDAMEDRCLK